MSLVFSPWGSDKFLAKGQVDAASRFNVLQILTGDFEIAGWRIYSYREGDLLEDDNGLLLFKNKYQALDYLNHNEKRLP